MKKIVVYEDKQVKIENQTKPVIAEKQVLIAVSYSGVNYKDALALTSSSKILRSLPLTPGIDLSGLVIESKSDLFKEGDEVLINGCGMGENWNGAYANYVVSDEENIVNLPRGLSLKEAMIIGTAGFTAALALHRMEVNGQVPEMGPVLVSGASGGVGSFACMLLAKKGYEVIAVSSKEKEKNYLLELGAKEVVSVAGLNLGSRPLESVRFGGLVDNLGGEFLSKAVSSIQLWGNVACIGLALEHKAEFSVMPMILRGVSLLGISSNNTSYELRKTIWNNLGELSLSSELKKILRRELEIEDLVGYCKAMLDQKTSGRAILRFNELD